MRSRAVAPGPSPLETDGATLERWLASVGRRLADFVDGLETASASTPGVTGSALADPAWVVPREGRDFDALMAKLFEAAIPPAFNTAGPGYLAYIPGGGLPLSGIGALIGDITNRFTGLAVAAPVLVEIECAVIRWLCQAVGLPTSAFGILTTGGSMANFIATVAARIDRLPDAFLGGTLYTSSETHHSVTRAARIAGFPVAAVRLVPTDPLRRMRVDALAEAIDRDRRNGHTPFMVIAAAGTTNTGAVDPMEAIAELAAANGLWFHVDGAYGGAFMLTERGRTALRGIERADSVTLDPHKGFFLPYGTGALLVRDRRTLEVAHQSDAAYLPTADAGAVDFSALSGELSRDFRGLRLWLPLQVAGADAFRDALDEKLDLAAEAAEAVAAIPGVEMVAVPQLSLFAFRLGRADVTPEARDLLNRRFLDAVNRRGRVYLSGTVLDDGFVIRLCVLSFRTHADRIAMAIEDIHTAALEVQAP